ncbi:hypothetical protein JMJ35_010008 [Cladonia borealis]|uniref:Major facilitator superfamily (MFS) profile domain-containing protein n=1 Tax=Cladonia borealis TaxID=184061 RepID=A0AA39QSX6_9LECA|nr:hypothetical protein JMJ35_010008 [Cladonia borealis]
MGPDTERAEQGSRRKPWLLQFRSSNGFILATVCVAIFTDAFLYGVVVPVLPFSLRERSGVPEDQVQWWNSFIFAVFGAAILIGSPICGWVADHTSDRSISFYTGLLVLAAATVLFGVARSSWVLLISRLLQGLSAAITYTVGLALLVDTVGRDNIGQWMGTALSSSSFGLIVSPLLGGIVYAKVGYMAVFGMALGLICVDIVMRLCMIEKKHAAKYTVSESTAPANGFYGTFTNPESSEHEHGQSNGHSNGHTHSNGSAQPTNQDDPEESAPLLSTTSPQKPTHHTPAIFLLLSIPRLLTAIYGIFVNVSILAAFDGVLPLYVKHLFQWSSLNAGLIFMCLAIPALTGPLVGNLSDRLGPRWIAVAGCSLTTPPLILLRLVNHDSFEQKILLCVLLVCCGFTLILIVSPVAADLSAVVEHKERTDPGIFGPGGAYAQAFALFNCSMAAATLFGPVAAGALIERWGWGVMTACMGVFAFSGAVPAFLWTGGWIFAKK